MKDWTKIEDELPPKSACITAECDDDKQRTLWRCGCNDPKCELYMNAPNGEHLSIEIIKWRLR